MSSRFHTFSSFFASSSDRPISLIRIASSAHPPSSLSFLKLFERPLFFPESLLCSSILLHHGPCSPVFRSKFWRIRRCRPRRRHKFTHRATLLKRSRRARQATIGRSHTLHALRRDLLDYLTKHRPLPHRSITWLFELLPLLHEIFRSRRALLSTVAPSPVRPIIHASVDTPIAATSVKNRRIINYNRFTWRLGSYSF